jgi:hypothetical protein
MKNGNLGNRQLKLNSLGLKSLVTMDNIDIKGPKAIRRGSMQIREERNMAFRPIPFILK